MPWRNSKSQLLDRDLWPLSTSATPKLLPNGFRAQAKAFASEKLSKGNLRVRYTTPQYCSIRENNALQRKPCLHEMSSAEVLMCLTVAHTP